MAEDLDLKVELERLKAAIRAAMASIADPELTLHVGAHRAHRILRDALELKDERGES